MMKKPTKTAKQKIIAMLKEVYDPELPVNIYDLGLIYNVDFDPSRKTVHILMTLTTPSCPAAELLPANVKEAVVSLPFIQDVMVEITFDPPYSTDRMSEEAKLILGYTD